MKQESIIYRYGDGVEKERTRLRADDGKALTQDGVNLWDSIDVDSVDGWREIDYFEPMDNPTDEEALTRYANELTGQNDQDLLSAAESMITKLSKEES